MLSLYIYAFGSVLIVSLVSLIGIVTLALNERILKKCIFLLVSLAVGALLGGAFIHLIPEAIESSSNIALTSTLIILGMFLFFALEKFLHWQHVHTDKSEAYHHHEELKEALKSKRVRPLGYMILASDGLHNLLDGITIGVSYMVSIEVGIAATVAIILHEIPQEIGDFGVLLHAGFSKARALFVNFLSALLAVLGVAIALVVGESLEGFANWVIPLAAGSFIYIAGSDLIPELHKTKDARSALLQLAAVAIGVLAMLALLGLE